MSCSPNLEKRRSLSYNASEKASAVTGMEDVFSIRLRPTDHTTSLHSVRSSLRIGIAVLLLSSLAVFPADRASAAFLDKLKEVTSKARDIVKDAKDTVVGSREVVREVEDLKQTILYADSYTPSRQEASRLQSSLGQMGFAVGNPDGLIGEKTRDAIRLYQSMSGLPVDGIMTYDLVQSVVSDAQRSKPVQAKLSKNEWQQYQQLLNRMGYAVGAPDGIPGKKTRAAVENFLMDRQLPVVSHIERYGFVAAQRAAQGEAVSSISSDSLSTGSDTALSSGQVTLGNDSLGVAAQELKPAASREWLTIGSNAIGDKSDIDAQRVLALVLLESQPELVEDLERVDAWFKLEGNTVESEYLRQGALEQFRESLLLQRVDKPVFIRAYQRIQLRRGDYDAAAGIFKVTVGSFSEYIKLPHLNLGAFNLAIQEQLPSKQPSDDYATFSGKTILGIPMSLEQAIELEKTQMVNSKGRQQSHMFLTGMAEVSVDSLTMPPLARGETSGSTTFRRVTADAKLLRLSLHKNKRGRGDGNLGELFHEWPITPAGDSSTNTLVASSETIPASADVQSVADRFEMSIVDGYLDTTTGNLSQFAAALAMGHKPELLDTLPDALYLAEALLNQKERQELFGRVRSVGELDEVTAEKVHQRIKSELRALFVSRGIPSDLPLLLVHSAKLGQFDVDSQRFPLSAGSRSGSVYGGTHTIVSRGRGPVLSAKTGTRWVPEEIVSSGDAAVALQNRVFGTKVGQRNANVRHGRFGSISDLNVRMYSKSASQPALSVVLTFEVSREVLMADKFDDVLYEFPVDNIRQAEFDKLLGVLSHPVAGSAALIESVIRFPEVDRFRKDFVLSSNHVTSANEFDRGEQIQKVTTYLEQQAARQSGPLWMSGSVTLGKYQFETQSFEVNSLTLSSASGNTASNQIYFRARIENKAYGDFSISMSKERAQKLVEAVSDRKFDIRARVTPLGAVAELNSARTGSSILTITHQLDELALVMMPRNTSRQEWELLSHDQFSVESLSAGSTQDSVIQPVEVQLGDEPFIDSDLLLLMAAQSSSKLGDAAWSWLQQSRHAYDTSGASRIGTRFFEDGGAKWDKSIGQINTERFKGWVSAIKLPDLNDVKILLSTDYSKARPSADQCHWVRSEMQWSRNTQLTFVTADVSDQSQTTNSELAKLRRDEFVVESAVRAGFLALSGMDCLSGRSQKASIAVLPKITLVFDRLPALSASASKAAVVSATVTGLEFTENGIDIPDVIVSMSLQQIDFYDGSNVEQAQLVRSFNHQDLLAPEPVGKDPRLAAADVVGVKLGMSLDEAASELESHFEVAQRLSLRRGFTTNPQRYENGDIWHNKASGEYIVLFFEGDSDAATVLGITRGLHLDSSGFDRAAALELLRTKYGPEDGVTADASLNLVWGKYVTSWPEVFGRTQTEYRSGRGACQIDLRKNSVPADLRDDSGAVVGIREFLGSSKRGNSFHIRWPQISNPSVEVSPDCDYYLEAFHDDREGASVFLGMFDIAAYEEAFQLLQDSSKSSKIDANESSTKKPLVKF